jgi:hypothetical protein
MQKVNFVIAALVVAAIAATVVGLSFFEPHAEKDLYFVRGSVELDPLVANVPAAGATLEWPVPNNGTSAQVQGTLRFAGQAIQGGTAQVRLELQLPDGSVVPWDGAMQLAPGAQSQVLDFELEGQWAELPSEVKADPDHFDATTAWPQPLVLRVSVTPPSDHRDVHARHSTA